MSSIERAMSKLAGDGNDGEKLAAPTPAAEPPAAENAAAAIQQGGSPAASTARPDPGASGPAPSSERSTATRADATPGSATAPPLAVGASDPNFVHVDVERLAAAGLLVPDQPMTRQSEEFQHIKRRLLGNMVPGILRGSRPPNLVLVTSSVPGEGKTFTSVNLAISIAMEVDHTVLVVDTDIMKRDLSKVFGVANRPGLFDLLANPRLHLEDLLVRTSIPNLVLLPSGNRRDGSTELLASLRMIELTNEMSARYHDRVVLFDSPPILATTTATALAPAVGQIILVAEAGKTTQETIGEALSRLDNVRVTGVILNKAKQQVTPGYDYYGSYYQTR